jgi:hypothetical protein
MSDVPQINVNVVDGLPEAPQDSVTYGRRNAAWVDMTAPANLVLRQGTADEVAAETLLEGEPAWATDTKLLYVGDGLTAGGVAVGGLSVVLGDAFINGGRVRLANSVAGGSAPNAIGVGAVDLQTFRDAATNVVSGQYGFSAGRGNTVSGTHAVATGRGMNANIPYSVVHGAAIGALDIAHVRYFFQAVTTNATPTTMESLQQTAPMPVPSGYMFCGTLRVFGHVVSNASDHALYERRIIAKNIAGTTTVPTVTDVATVETNANWDLAVEADDTNDRVKVVVTGVASTTIAWLGLFDGLMIKVVTL